MHAEIVIAGFGGQGVLFAGQLLAYAGLANGRHVTWIPSYGPEMRGGTAHCTVIISDEEIGSPLVRNPTAAVVLNTPSLELYAPLVKPGGVLVVDASLIHERGQRADIHEIDLPAKDIALSLGLPQVANVVLLGALVAATGVVTVEALNGALAAHLGEDRREAIWANEAALQQGAAWVGARLPA